MTNDIRVSLSVDAAEIGSMRFDCDRAVVAMVRRPDGKVAVAFSRDDDGLPPVHAFTTGGDGYPGASVFIWRKVLVTAPPEKAGTAWQLVRAVGWDPSL
jgi:hypothetical protein